MLQKLMDSSKDWEEFMKKVEELLPYPSSDDIEI
jgi:hypothetical protein